MSGGKNLCMIIIGRIVFEEYPYRIVIFCIVPGIVPSNVKNNTHRSGQNIISVDGSDVFDCKSASRDGIAGESQK